MALGALDEHYGITDKVIAGLDSMGEDISDRIAGAKQELIKKAGQAAGSLLDYAIDSARAILVDAAKHSLDKFFSGRPRLR